MADWIWLDAERYPQFQRSRYYRDLPAEWHFPYCVAEFCLDVPLPASADVTLDVSADTVYRLEANGEVVGQGPCAAGGDFECKLPIDHQYSDRVAFRAPRGTLRLRALVRNCPVEQCEFSKGRPGLWISGTAACGDGTAVSIGTDGRWLCRPATAFADPDRYDATRPEAPFAPAVPLPDVWHAQPSGLPPMTEEPVALPESGSVTVAPGERVSRTAALSRVYSAYLVVAATGAVTVQLEAFESPTRPNRPQTVVFPAEGGSYRSLAFHSVAGVRYTVENNGKVPADVTVSLIYTHFPILRQGSFRSSDPDLDLVYRLAGQNLAICRQTIHLDSPKHQEPLACTGDYLIETMMEAFTLGDLRLSALDCRRTAMQLMQNDGKMFHTTYSMMWVEMVWQTYLFTGERQLLSDCLPAMQTLFRRFYGYLDDRSLVDPPNYMFVDWVMTDGYTMHHPPKYLGQTAMNAYYCGGLQYAALIARELGDEALEREYRTRHAATAEAMREYLYDAGEGLFFDGLPDPQEAEGQWLPANEPRRHISGYPNVLAARYGVVKREEARRLLRAVAGSETLSAFQPYFMHFFLCAIWENGLFDELGMPLLRRWIPHTVDCPLGIKEGWYKPEPTYCFDYSHAWGGTPAYQLPRAVLGLEMLRPGWEEISLSPSSCGLSSVSVTVPTPKGDVVCRLENGAVRELTVPSGIRYTVVPR